MPVKNVFEFDSVEEFEEFYQGKLGYMPKDGKLVVGMSKFKELSEEEQEALMEKDDASAQELDDEVVPRDLENEYGIKPVVVTLGFMVTRGPLKGRVFYTDENSGEMFEDEVTYLKDVNIPVADVK